MEWTRPAPFTDGSGDSCFRTAEMVDSSPAAVPIRFRSSSRRPLQRLCVIAL